MFCFCHVWLILSGCTWKRSWLCCLCTLLVDDEPTGCFRAPDKSLEQQRLLIFSWVGITLESPQFQLCNLELTLFSLFLKAPLNASSTGYPAAEYCYKYFKRLLLCFCSRRSVVSVVPRTHCVYETWRTRQPSSHGSGLCFTFLFAVKPLKPLKIKLVDQRLQQSGMNGKQRQLIFILQNESLVRKAWRVEWCILLFTKMLVFWLLCSNSEYFELQT